jgi:glycosyltransferase involved in cell wall biosynthesis
MACSEMALKRESNAQEGETQLVGADETAKSDTLRTCEPSTQINDSFRENLRAEAAKLQNDDPIEPVRVRRGVQTNSSYSVLQRTVRALVSALRPARQQAATAGLAARLPKIVVVNTFPVWPPRSGGQQRIASLYGELSERLNITVVSLSSQKRKLQTIEFGSTFREVIVPRTATFQKHVEALSRRLGGRSVDDLAAIHGLDLVPAFGQALERVLDDASLVVVEHPYCFYAVERLWRGRVVYSAHNVEALLKQAVLPRSDAGRQAIDEIATIECNCCKRADAIAAVTEQDAAAMASIYGVSPDKIAVVSNGANIPRNPVLDWILRQEKKQSLSLCGPVAIFIGSNHEPNLQGALATFKIARQAPEWLFLLAGSMCEALTIRESPRPENVHLLGQMSRQELVAIMAAADVGLNPVSTGGGSNLKTVEYAANGLLVVTTPTGNRGFEFRNGEQCLVGEPDELPFLLGKIRASSPTAAEAIARAGFDHAAKNFAWQQIAMRYSQSILGLCVGSEL